MVTARLALAVLGASIFLASSQGCSGDATEALPTETGAETSNGLFTKSMQPAKLGSVNAEDAEGVSAPQWEDDYTDKTPDAGYEECEY